MSVTNPWLSLPISKPLIAPCDTAIINRLLSRNKTVLFPDLYPEPYMGDPDARVYLLNGNPGYSDTDNCFSFPSSVMHSIMPDVYSHRIRSFIWNDYQNPVQTICPRTGRTIVHPGHEYWQKKLKRLTQEIGHNPKIFVLEFFPYHSRSFLPFMKKPLYSFDYTKDLIENAIGLNKLFFVLRHESEWLAAIPNLKTANLFTLKSKIGAYLTPGNMDSHAWSTLLNNC